MSFIAIIIFIILIVKVNSLSNRITVLEKKSQSVQVSPAPVTVASVATPEPVIQPVVSTTSSAVPIANPVQSPFPVYTREQTHDEVKTGTWFAGIGALALVMALGFLLRYAFVHNIITEPLRVLLGIGAGVICLGIGYYLRNKYADYAGIVAGAGLGLMYISAYASHASYHLVSYATALTMIFVISVIGMVGSTYVRSSVFAVWALVGAYLTPFLLGSNPSDIGYFFTYLTILNLYSVSTSVWFKWSSVTVTNLVGTCLMFYASSGLDKGNELASSIFLVINFIVFFVAALLRYMKDKSALNEQDYVVSAGSAFMFYISLYIVLNQILSSYALGMMTLIFALFYGITWYMVRATEQAPSYFRYESGAFALGFLTLAVPVAFDYSTVTLFWAVEAIIFGLIATWIGSSIAAFFSTALFIGVASRVIAIDRIMSGVQTSEMFILNKIFLSAMAIVIMMIVMIVLYHVNRNRFKDENVSVFSEAKPRTHINTLIFVSLGLVAVMSSLEVDMFNKSTDLLPLLYMILASVGVLLGMEYGSRSIRVVSYITAGVAVMNGYFMSYQITTPFFNERIVLSLVYAGLLLVIAYAVYNAQRAEVVFTERDIIKPIAHDERNLIAKGGFIVANIIALAAITREIMYYFETISESTSRVNAERVTISVTWLLYGVGLLVLGIAKKLISARKLSVVLLTIVIIKIFLFDTAGLSDIYRFVAYGILGVVLLVVGYLYNKYKERIAGFIKGEQI
ncbi:MAG: hypothetical protein RLY57_378 [Candidatus Parcubacteria bacterium]|jgi:uncharacterized membrane protein